MSIQAIRWAVAQKVGGPALKAALLVLAERANANGVCWPSVATLAEAACTDPRSMRRFLGRLRDAGLLTIEPHAGRLSTYRLHLRTPDAESAPTPDPQSSVTPGRESGVTASQSTPDPQSLHPGLTVSHPGPSVLRTVVEPEEPAAPSEQQPHARADARPHEAADALVEDWAGGRRLLAPQRRDLSRAVDQLLNQGADPQLIPATLDEAHGNPEWRWPARVLGLAYERVERAAHQRAQPPARLTGTGPVELPPGTSTQRANAFLALMQGGRT